MATYFFETITAARALCAISFAAPANFAPEGGGGGAAAAEASPQAAAQSPAEPAAAPGRARVKMETAIVRHGTVVVGDHGSEVHVGPGGEVTLSVDEVRALRTRGVLHDPNSGPTFAGGPEVDMDSTEPTVREGKAAPARRKR